MRSSGKEKQQLAWWPIVVIVLSACAFCWPVFAGRIMLPADMCLLMLPWQHLQEQFGFHRAHNPMLDPIQQYLPWRIYAVESLRDGIIPLWNPYAFCGTPFLANLQSTVLYPLNLLFLVTGAAHGFGVSSILHLMLGGLFMYAFLRTLALSQAASLLGALVLMFNGWTVTWLEFPTLSLWVFMWLPALLLCYERALRQPRSLWPLLCALVIGTQFLGGHLQISAYVLIAFALYVIVRMVSRDERIASRPLAFGIALVAIIIGFALASAQLLPTLELVKQTGRVGHGASAALKTAFPLTHLILYLVPNFFGNPVDYNYWGNIKDPTAFNYFETACYVGILPLFLAVLSFAGKRTWRHWFFGGLTLFALLAAIGSPLYLVLYYLAPGFHELAGLGRVLCLAVFGIAGLAAIGLDALLGSRARTRPTLPVVIAVAACLCIVLARVAFQPYVKLLDSGWHFDFYLKHQVAIAFALIALSTLLIALRLRGKLRFPFVGAIACALVLTDLFVLGIRFNPFTDPRMAYPETDAIRWLQQHAGHDRIASLADKGFLDWMDWMPHNSPMIFGLRDIHGSDSLRVRRSFELVSGPELAQAKYPPADSSLLDALGVRYLITRQQVGGKWKLVHDGEVPIYQNTQALPRAYLAFDMYPGSEAVGLVALQAAGRPRRVAVLHPDEYSIGLGRMENMPVDPDAEVRFVRDAPNEVVIEARSKGPAILVLTDSYYPGWRASRYGTSEPVIRTNYGFRGVPVGNRLGGTETVTMRYVPATFRIGLFVSLLACAALAAAAMGVYLAKDDTADRTAAQS
jgi:hypothetical protein